MSSSNQSSAEPELTQQDAKIAVQNVKKLFGRIVALDDVSLAVEDNEILALIGDNGAGKSTLMNIFCGNHEPTDGQLYYDGEPVSFSSPEDARDLGIETVYQDLALMGDLDVATNIFIGNFPSRTIGPINLIDWDRTYDEAENIIQTHLKRDIDPRAEVDFHSGGERQLVAIARALAFDPEVVILDEPTSALSVDATNLVHDTITNLKRNGHTIILVSHSMEEVFSLADRVAVLHQGELVDVVQTDSVTQDELEHMMTTGTRP
ncbi:sugar ABC transporter ATP-binding protein [Natronolimnobius sp. AArcel1]|uniref:ATP-binding cassette domain-containing protein n=1 Tax=Natronolimnobius sp. AArcel1 TaxID=1679093 RepID=UPI0013EB182E|nr:ATP-binding cassette domain-containing protein [Natronolimnobius sp. AArcel1]NGM70512.1 sugar ABC transporter ATP-binding protein [Natronolimnobius sp. AArcel1]